MSAGRALAARLLGCALMPLSQCRPGEPRSGLIRDLLCTGGEVGPGPPATRSYGMTWVGKQRRDVGCAGPAPSSGGELELRRAHDDPNPRTHPFRHRARAGADPLDRRAARGTLPLLDRA